MRIIAIMTVILVGSAWAESTPVAPANPESAYQSALGDYRVFKDEPLKGWREANDEMRRLGGHMGHLDAPTAGSDVPPTQQEPNPTEGK